jgi:hypothetical protein
VSGNSKTIKTHAPAAFSRVVRATALSLIAFAGSALAQNILVNGDFEKKPPSNYGNNIGHDISPWILGTGQQANVVKVDGPGPFDYGSNGPESDASTPGASQHYLDITDGSNDFYQTFTPRCSGQVRFGGFFSTRANSAGNAKVRIVQGTGVSGQTIGVTNTVYLPGGNSKTDGWKKVDFLAPVTANTTYSFVVSMDNNMNFDDGFVEYIENCPAQPVNVDPCCPPWNAEILLNQLKLTQSGSILGDFSISFMNSAPYKNQMQAYIDYLNAISLDSIKNIVLYWAIEDRGPSGHGTSPGPIVPPAQPEEFTEWSCGTKPCKGYSTYGGGGNITNGDGSNVFAASRHPLKPNRWYRIYTYIYLNDGNKFWPEKCSSVAVDFTLYAGPAALAASDPNRIAVEYRVPGASSGRIIMLPLNRTPGTT